MSKNKPSMYSKRRRELMQMMEGGVAVIPTAPEQSRNGDVLYQFRPDSDFYYLSHFPEPESVMVLAPGRAAGEFIIFCRERDTAREMWDGRRTGIEGAVDFYEADDSFPIEDIDEILPGLLENREKVYCSMGRYPEFDSRLIQWMTEVKGKVRTGIHAPGELVDIGHILHEMRLIKGADEQKLMRKAGKISADAHCRAMRACKPGMYEYQLEAELEYGFRLGGSHYPAYPSIVASGGNACILHYTENTEQLRDGDLVLIDAGAELDCYASDITRTFPVNGKFSTAQKAVYDVVLESQYAAIAACGKDKEWNDPHNAAVNVLCQGMLDLGLLKGSFDEAMETHAYRRFYMHRTGHWLGIDVHDVGDYRLEAQWRPLEPGMVLTVEPGMYISPAEDVAEEFHNIGIRIEDDVLITRNGPEILSSGVPKTTEDIEALMQQ
ncbi:MAG: Xaa-Pro aminopeptidase [Parasphingorhabdus sp.]|jgi:Xaa-Pro aminopeptidase